MECPKLWHQLQTLAETEPQYIEQVLEQVRTRGPISISELEDAGDRKGSWWGGGKGKVALEWLFRRVARKVTAPKTRSTHGSFRTSPRKCASVGRIESWQPLANEDF